MTVYSDEALTAETCTLRAAKALPTAGAGYGFMISSTGYSVMLGPFAEQCQGVETGYIATPEVEVLGVRTWLIPIAQIYAPR